MAITSTDILFKLSTKSGSAGNSLSSTPAASLGKYISTTQITDATTENLFDNVTGDENAASDVEYRCFFVHNAHGSLPWQNVVVWIFNDVAGGAASAIGVDPTAASAVGASSPQAVEVADESTAPAGVTFFTGTAIDTKAEGLAIGTLNAGQCRAIWVRRTAANTGALSNDGLTIRVEGDTAE